MDDEMSKEAKAARAAYYRKYYAEHKEQRKEANRKYYYSHPEKRKESQQKSRAKKKWKNRNSIAFEHRKITKLKEPIWFTVDFGGRQLPGECTAKGVIETSQYHEMVLNLDLFNTRVVLNLECFINSIPENLLKEILVWAEEDKNDGENV